MLVHARQVSIWNRQFFRIQDTVHYGLLQYFSALLRQLNCSFALASFPIGNAHENPQEGWIPDKKELAKIKIKTDKLDLVKIGNVHSHPMPNKKDYDDYMVSGKRLSDFDDQVDMWEEFGSPSDMDLKYARKFNDIIRGILVVDDLGVYHHVWHDKFGNRIKLYFDEEIRK